MSLDYHKTSVFYCRAASVFEIVRQYAIPYKLGINMNVSYINSKKNSVYRSTTDAIIYMYTLGLLRFVTAIGLLRRSRLKIYAHSSSLTDVET